MESLLFLIIAIPAASAAILLLGGKYTDAWGHLLGTAAPIASFVLGRRGVLRPRRRRATRPCTSTCSPGSTSARSTSSSALLFDPLSALFVLLITGVGSLIHVYSIGYMEHDARRRRFFAYLNLFVAAMLMLVLATTTWPCSSAGRASAWRRTC